MLSHKVLTRQDIGRAASYYADAADDYFAKEGEATEWQGRGAASLKLSGPVDPRRFRELLAGRIDASKPALRTATRQDSNARLGIDFTFSAPKSVSLQALVTGDGALVRAHDLAVQRTLAVAEERAQARKKVDGRNSIENTRNLVVATFRHETSRERDPQLHTHAVLLNLTRREDGQWRALRNDQLIKATKYLGAVYRAELATELRQLGYDLRHGRDGLFELGRFSPDQLERFSTRGSQIEQHLAKKGLDRASATTRDKQRAALATRTAKRAIDRDALHADWRARALELDMDLSLPSRPAAAHEHSPAEKGRGSDTTLSDAARSEAARAAVRYAINHHTERQAILGHPDIVDTALKQAMGSARLPEIEQEIARLVSLGSVLTEATTYVAADTEAGLPKSRAAWIAERVRAGRSPERAAQLVDRAIAENHLVLQEGESSETPLYRARDAFAPQASKSRTSWIADRITSGLSSRHAVKVVTEAIQKGQLIPQERRYTTRTALGREKRILDVARHGRGNVVPVMSPSETTTRLHDVPLTAGQRSAVELILTSSDRVIGIQGYAGTGKSHLLATAKAQLESAGFNVRALAPYASQVRALRTLGVTSNTLASLLGPRAPALDKQTVLVIDEAGVVPTRLMDRALRLAEQHGARVVLLGDTAQTKAIEAGRPFDQLQASGMATARVEEIRRQQNPELKRAVEIAARGDAPKALACLKTVYEIRDPSQRHQVIAAEYAQLSPEDRERTIIVSGTNEARREINQLVRHRLGRVGQGRSVTTLVRRDTTQVERLFSKNYERGDFLQPERDYQRYALSRGKLYEVLETGPANQLTVRSQQDGQVLRFNPLLVRKLSVYSAEETELAAGDRIRMTRNDAALDIANGDRATVTAISERGVRLQLDSQRTIEVPAHSPLHLDLAYATTVHSSQGTTADRVLIDATTKSRTTSKDVFYVAISRARHEARIFTDDKTKLPAAVQRENVKHAALDLALAQRESPRRDSPELEI